MAYISPSAGLGIGAWVLMGLSMGSTRMAYKPLTLAELLQRLEDSSHHMAQKLRDHPPETQNGGE